MRSIILLIILSTACLRSQVKLDVVFAKGEKGTMPSYQPLTSDRMAAVREINKVIRALHEDGFLLAEADTVMPDSMTVKAYIKQGERVSIARVRLGNLHPSVASGLGISEKIFRGQPYQPKEMTRIFDKIVTYYENNGYPFATVRIDSAEVEDGRLSGVLHVERNKLFVMDSLVMLGTVRVDKKFMTRYLGIKEGMPYDEKTLSSIDSKILQLPFVKSRQPVQVRLTEKQNRILLFLDKKNASQFDGIIGILPDAATGKTTITGDIKLKVVNGVLHHGETFDIQWRRLKSMTQDVNGRVIYPYLFGSPFGIDYNLKIYRRDTTFVDINNNFGIQYYFNGLSYVKFFYKQRNSNLISTSGLETVSTLPDYADVSTQAYGAGVFYEKLDYRFNPSSGVSFSANVQMGNRQIRVNPGVNAQAYEGVQLRTAQYQYDAVVAGYIPLAQKNVLKLQVQSASVFGAASLFTNELLRIGGFRTLRGFDEESIFTSAYLIPTIEYRFLFARNSSLLAFAEGAWYENNANHSYVSDRPMSFGGGINFETRAGILSILYAIGNQFHNGFDPRSGKIHFGLVALF